MEVDQVSSANVNNLTIKQLESASPGVLLNTIVGSSSQAANSPSLTFDQVLAYNLVCISKSKGCLFDLSLDKQSLEIKESEFSNNFGENSTIFNANLLQTEIKISLSQFKSN